ncbi:MAG: hypothetical protein ACT4TC_01125 [Myxococcaceae bacterium]
MSTQTESKSTRGAQHEGLMGGAGALVRFRPERMVFSDPTLNVRCRYQLEGKQVGPVPVLDVSAAGIGIGQCPAPLPAPGTNLKLELLIGDDPVWEGEAAVMHVVDVPHMRLGARFTSGLLDMRQLQARTRHVEGGVLKSLERLNSTRDTVPESFRSNVGDLRVMLADARTEFERMERGPLSLSHDDENKVFNVLLERWGKDFYGKLSEVWKATKTLSAEQQELARTYATTQLLPLMLACPIHRRAFEKPLGYAGDYHLMTLYFAKQLTGEGLFGRFLHLLGKNYTLGKTVIDRVRCMREVVRETINQPGDGPVRILSVACGPALELQQLIDSLEMVKRPVELILMDQDEEALETAHHLLSDKLVQKHKAKLPITLTCLHLSVRQLLKPNDEHELQARQALLNNLDLIYSAGLFDYLPENVAMALVVTLFGGLRSGGRVLVGNLKEAADTCFTMEYVVAWHLIYRVQEQMKKIGSSVASQASSVNVWEDATEHCMFLDVRA